MRTLPPKKTGAEELLPPDGPLPVFGTEGAGRVAVAGAAVPAGVGVDGPTVAVGGGGVAGAVGVAAACVPTSMPVIMAQSGRMSGRSQKTATTEVPRPWTTKQPLACGPLVVISLLLPPLKAVEEIQTKVALLPAPTSTKAVPMEGSGVAWNGAAVQPALAASAVPEPGTSPAAPTKSATPPIAAEARSRLPLTEMV